MVKLVCANFWQTMAHHHVDAPHETKHLYEREPFAPENVKEMEVVFVKTDFLDWFLSKTLGAIGVPFVLVTAHGDVTPSMYAMQTVQRSPRIARWYAVNCPWTDYKTVAIPNGLAEPDRPFGDQQVIEDCMRELPETKALSVFCPADSPTHPVRAVLKELDHSMLIRGGEERLSYRDYLRQVGKHKFLLCPRGAGLEVHRVYEAILMKTIPIYFTDYVPAVYTKLPVIVVQSVPDLLRVLDNLADAAREVDWDAAQAFLKTENVASAYGFTRDVPNRRLQ